MVNSSKNKGQTWFKVVTLIFLIIIAIIIFFGFLIIVKQKFP